MQLEVTRKRNMKMDRKGNVKDASFTVRFELEASPDEQREIESNDLGWHVVFKSTQRTVFARELLDGGAEWTVEHLDVALSIQQSLIENSRELQMLIARGATFEGTETLDLSA